MKQHWNVTFSKLSVWSATKWNIDHLVQCKIALAKRITIGTKSWTHECSETVTGVPSDSETSSKDTFSKENNFKINRMSQLHNETRKFWKIVVLPEFLN